MEFLEPILPIDEQTDEQQLEKDAAAFEAVTEFQTALLNDSVIPIRTDSIKDPDVAEVIDLFNKFVSEKVDPYAFLGFVRMNVHPNKLEKAEPYIWQMVKQGIGQIYMPVGAISCDSLKSSVVKARIKPLYLHASSKCVGCVYNRNGHCTKIGMSIKADTQLTDEDVNTFAVRVVSRYAYLEDAINSVMITDISPVEKYAHVLSLLATQKSAGSSRIDSDSVEFIESFRDPELNIVSGKQISENEEVSFDGETDGVFSSNESRTIDDIFEI